MKVQADRKGKNKKKRKDRKHCLGPSLTVAAHVNTANDSTHIQTYLWYCVCYLTAACFIHARLKAAFMQKIFSQTGGLTRKSLLIDPNQATDNAEDSFKTFLFFCTCMSFFGLEHPHKWVFFCFLARLEFFLVLCGCENLVWLAFASH